MGCCSARELEPHLREHIADNLEDGTHALEVKGFCAVGRKAAYLPFTLLISLHVNETGGSDHTPFSSMGSHVWPAGSHIDERLYCPEAECVARAAAQALVAYIASHAQDGAGSSSVSRPPAHHTTSKNKHNAASPFPKRGRNGCGLEFEHTRSARLDQIETALTLAPAFGARFGANSESRGWKHARLLTPCAGSIHAQVAAAGP